METQRAESYTEPVFSSQQMRSMLAEALGYVQPLLPEGTWKRWKLELEIYPAVNGRYSQSDLDLMKACYFYLRQDKLNTFESFRKFHEEYYAQQSQQAERSD